MEIRGITMKTLLAVLFFSLFFISVCNAQDNPYIIVNNKKISLRYTKRTDVEMVLGKPEKVQYYENGGEDFFWTNFTVCTYDDDKLSFHYNQNNDIIRITVNAGYFTDIVFFEHNIKDITRRDILEKLSILNKNDITVFDNFISYFMRYNKTQKICYSFWFDKNKIKWIDMYYVSQW
jgi:hypothetical protein